MSWSTAILLGLLGIAVASDLWRHRIPNLLVLLGLGVGLIFQAYLSGLAGVGAGVLGMLICAVVFLPLYAFGGMAAGDVKLMAMVGSFMAPHLALFAALLSLLAGGLLGFGLILARGQAGQTLQRYWLMVRSRLYVAPAADEVAGQPFPFAAAILAGTAASLLWQPSAPWSFLG